MIGLSDKERAEQISMAASELLENAVKYAPPETGIRIDWKLAEGVVEGRQVRRDLAELVEREVAYASRRSSMAHLVEMIRVCEHERAPRQVDDVELDQMHSRREGRAERAQRVLRCEGGSAAVTDAQRTVCAAVEVDGQAV
jgi:hypothetical protein